MSGVKILHFLKDWWKSIPIHQNYTMALRAMSENIHVHVATCQLVPRRPHNSSGDHVINCRIGLITALR